MGPGTQNDGVAIGTGSRAQGEAGLGGSTPSYEEHSAPLRGLGRDLRFRIHGTGGEPVLVFPTELATREQWHAFGMLEPYAADIANGRRTFWCVDGLDTELFFGRRGDPERVAGLQAYEDWILDEVMPRIRERHKEARLVIAGAAFGATQAAVLATRRPAHWWSRVICLAGRYDVSRWLRGKRDGDAFLWDPLAFMPTNNEEQYLAPMRQIAFSFVTPDTGAQFDEANRLSRILLNKGVAAQLHSHPAPFQAWDQWRGALLKHLPV